MNFIKNNKKLISLCGCIMIVLGCFLPLASAYDLYSINYISGDGKFVIIAIIIAAILIVLNKHKVSLIPSVVAAIFFANNTIKIAQINGVVFKLGFVLILIGFVITIVFSFINCKKHN